MPQKLRPRFIAPMPGLQRETGAWRDRLARIEDLGFDEVAISEHYSRGWAMEPLTALAFAAALTTRLRLLTLVLNNDIRHPAVLAKAMATVDVLSEGRVTLGIGAGWLPADYDALGIPFESPGTRLARLEEGIGVIRAFFAGGTVQARGKHYQVTGLEALPGTVQYPNLPILVGAGGPRMLSLAGRVADIAGIHVTLGPHGFDERAARELSAASIRAKIRRVREAADAEHRPPPAFEFTPVVVIVDGDRSTAVRPGFTDYIESRPAEFADSPAVLAGTAGEVAESIHRWTEELGIELWHLGADIELAGRVVAAARR
ncbi:MAG: LLM class flavin-dependent oxidoreductase [Microbacteriaceae bacterium]|nr:MAG: LLM class flavin-dependent oxidoreductase [Microbacteriaceae bacterium]